ncbi:MAG: 2-C-methyl-D-erythritol 4-phosphate cytidylyltransferase [Clostridia bacterium]|nr:2-C-methyl-D-erythritol 4-phosphate cytidylyltransferase [Clostridia bacterium]
MVSLIIAAAGTGSRMDYVEKKQFISLGNEPLLLKTVKQFLMDEIDEIIVVTGKEDLGRIDVLLEPVKLNKEIRIVEGGPRRQDSVYNALKQAKGDVVMIHDGARPFIKKETIKEHLKRIESCQGLITAVPTKDTIKVVEMGIVRNTLDRSTLMNVQTPQTFYRKTLIDAYDKAKEAVTDDASVMEQMGIPVEVVLGDYNNIKITTKEDLDFAEIIMKGFI